MAISKPFLPAIRELVRTYQAFEIHSARHLRTLNLTLSQFDIIATLGNTDGMSFKRLGEKTLITKGTLTGVVDRLTDKGLVRRMASSTDARSQIVQLTPAGEVLFSQVFPAHVAYIEQAFAGFQQSDFDRIERALHDLHRAFPSLGSEP